MRSSILATSLVCAVLARAALADEGQTASASLTGNMTLASEYLYRGIAQSNRKMAIQGGMDFSHASGAYAGVWASNISWLADAAPSAGAVSAPVEIDTYAGYKTSWGDLGVDAGVLKYWYPGTYPAGTVSPDTLEGYVGASWMSAGIKYSYAVSNLFGAQALQADGSVKKSDGSQYFDLSFNPELGAGLTLNLHAGRQLVANFPGASYNDFKLGLTKVLDGWAISTAYVSTTAKASAGDFYRSAAQNRDLGADRVVVTIGKTF